MSKVFALRKRVTLRKLFPSAQKQLAKASRFVLHPTGFSVFLQLPSSLLRGLPKYFFPLFIMDSLLWCSV